MKLNIYARILNNEYTREFVRNLAKEYKTKVPKKSILYGLATEMRPGLSLEEISTRCEIKNTIMKANFHKNCKSDALVVKIRSLLSNLEENRDNLSALLFAF